MDQASSLQLDTKDNGLSLNGKNLEEIAVAEVAVPIQPQKVIESPAEAEASNGTNPLEDATSTTTSESVDAVKKVQTPSNGMDVINESGTTDNHQDDELIRELAQFEGVKKDEDVTLNLPKATSEENGDKDTSDLLKDLESDSPCPGPSESETESATVNSAVDESAVSKPTEAIESMDVDQVDKSDDVQVDSTTESTQKRKRSVDISDDNVAKRVHMNDESENAVLSGEVSVEKQKVPSDIDSDTESKLLHENSDGEASVSEVVEAITSTSTDTKTTGKAVDEIKSSTEEVSSSDSVEVVPSSGDVPVNKVDAVADIENIAEAKSELEVSSNKLNDTTEAMEQDFNVTVEADAILANKSADNVTSAENTTETTSTTTAITETSTITAPITETLSSTIVDDLANVSESLQANRQSDVSTEVDSKALKIEEDTQSKKTEQEDIASDEPMHSQIEIDSEPEPQSSDDTIAQSETQNLNGPTEDTDVNAKVTSDSHVESSQIDSGKSDSAVESTPKEQTFEIRLLYEEHELKSVLVERTGEKKSEDSSGSETSAATPSETVNHTANDMVELCNFMINHFGAIKKSLNLDESTTDLNDSASSTSKPVSQRGRGSSKKGASQASPTHTTPKSGGKRASAAKRSLDKSDVDENEPKSKQPKNLNKVEENEEEEEQEEIKGDYCLARWSDRKYYAGRVTEEKPGNKFVVLFEDGATKVLSHEVIVFGTGNVLPLLDHSVHVLVSEETYEPGRVTKIDTEGDTVLYTVAAESKTVICSASNIYLMDDQAKAIHNFIKEKDGLMKTPETPSSKRTGRLPAKLEETVTSLSGGRSSRGKKGQPMVSPEAGFSGDADAKKSGRRSSKRIQRRSRTLVSESSEFSESIDEPPSNNSVMPLEAINGVQPELQSTLNDSEIFKQTLIAEYLGNDPSRGFDDLLGPMPRKPSLFRGKSFLLTCTIPIKTTHSIERDGRQFGTTPFFKEYIRQQIEVGGGTVYSFFDEIPKTKYKNCKLIAHHPCLTAKYVQCLAANIMPLSHEWIIDCCRENQLVNHNTYILPSGWSLIENGYKEWLVKRAKVARKSTQALKNTTVLMGSHNQEFSEFWQRVCKLASAEVRIIESLSDIVKSTKGIMLTDEDFAEDIKLKAEHFGIHVVSTVWVVESLIVGEACNPSAHVKLKQLFEDDDY